MKPHAWIIADKIAQKPRVIFDGDEADELDALGQDHLAPVFTQKDLVELAYEVRMAVLNQDLDESSDLDSFVQELIEAAK